MSEFWNEELSVGYYDKIVESGFEKEEEQDLTGILPLSIKF